MHVVLMMMDCRCLLLLFTATALECCPSMHTHTHTHACLGFDCLGLYNTRKAHYIVHLLTVHALELHGRRSPNRHVLKNYAYSRVCKQMLRVGLSPAARLEGPGFRRLEGRPEGDVRLALHGPMDVKDMQHLQDRLGRTLTGLRLQ